jgi:hypothetical protein
MKNYLKITEFFGFRNRESKIKFLFFTKKGIKLANFKWYIRAKNVKRAHVLIRLPGLYIRKHNNEFHLGTNNHYFVWHFYRKQLHKKKMAG